MAASTIRSKKTANKPSKSFEESLWDTATKLRGSVESADWSGAHQYGVAGFNFVHLRFAPVVLANGSMSTNITGDCPARSAMKTPKAKPQSLTRQREIRQKMVESDLVAVTSDTLTSLAA